MNSRAPRKPPPSTGQKFGRWTVVGLPTYSYVGNQARSAVPCRCDCGTERIVLVQTLRRSDRSNLSCGCWKRETVATLVSRTRWKDSHGRAASPPDLRYLYQLWKNINRRCHSPAAHNYRWYGGRGIKVWDPWRHDAGAFIEYVEKNLGPRPSPKHSINRIDNDRDYEPGNLDWQDAAGQARNRGGKFGAHREEHAMRDIHWG